MCLLFGGPDSKDLNGYLLISMSNASKIEVEQVQSDINKLNSKLDTIDDLLKKPFLGWTEDEKEEFGNKDLLRKKEEQRRDLVILKEKEKQATIATVNQRRPTSLNSDQALKKFSELAGVPLVLYQ